MNSPKEVGEIIKESRTNKGLTQKELAKILYVEEVTISRWECGLGYPNVATMEKLCDVLGLDFSSLLSDGAKNTKAKDPIDKKAIPLCLASIVPITILLAFSFLFKYPDGFYLFSGSTLSYIISTTFVLLTGLSLLLSLLLLAFLTKNKNTNIVQLLSFLSYIIVYALSVCVLFINENKLFAILLNYISFLCLTIKFIDLLVIAQKFTKSHYKITFIVTLVVLLLLSFFSYFVGVYLAFATSIILLEILFYLYSVVFNSFPLLFLSLNFKRKKWIVISLIIFFIFNTVFALHFIENSFIAFTFSILVYLGIVNFPIISLLFLNFRRKANDY